MFLTRLRWVFLILPFFLFVKLLPAQCFYTLNMSNSEGIDCCGAYVEVYSNEEIYGSFSCDSSLSTYTLIFQTNDTIDFVFHSGNCDSSISYSVIDHFNDTILFSIPPHNLDTFSHTINSICSSDSCIKPAALNTYNITENSAILNWSQNSADSLWNLNWGISGFVQGEENILYNVSESTYELVGLESETAYDCYVQTICDSNNLSDWLGPYTFNTNTVTDSGCYYTIYMYDSFGDGWNGAYLEVTLNDIHVGDYTVGEGEFNQDSVYSYSGALMNFIFHSGNWDSEIFFTIIDPLGDTLISSPAPEDLDNLIHTSNASCEPPTCINPSSLNANDISENSAILSWVQNSNDSIWNLNWGPSGFLQGTENIVNNLSVSSYELENLNNFTHYDFYVQTVCDSTDASVWSGPFTFVTQVQYGTCGAFIIELTDTYGDGWNDGFLDVQINGNSSENITLLEGYGPEYFFISVDSGDVVDLIYHEGGWPEENFYNVYDHSGNLVASEEGTLQSTYGLTACSNCSQPSNLIAYNIDTVSADLFWSSYTDSGGIWNLEWGISGFDLGSGNEIFDLNSLTYYLDGLSPQTEYQFYVQELCEGGFFSNWVGPYTFTTTSLPPSPGTCGMYTLVMYDTYGDGWNGGYLDVQINGNTTYTFFLEDGFGPQEFQFPVDSFDIVNLIYTTGHWDEENSYELLDNNNNLIVYQDGATNQNGSPGNTFGLFACQEEVTYSCGLFSIELYDAYGNGWNDGYLSVVIDSVLHDTMTLENGFGPAIMFFGLDSNQTLNLVYHPPIPHSQLSFLDGYRLKDSSGNIIVEEIGLDSTGPSSTYQINMCQDDISLLVEKINDYLLIYPNPAKEVLNIETNLKIERFIITNILGEIVYETTSWENHINISTFPPNVYFIRLETNDKIINKKIIVKH